MGGISPPPLQPVVEKLVTDESMTGTLTAQGTRKIDLTRQEELLPSFPMPTCTVGASSTAMMPRGEWVGKGPPSGLPRATATLQDQSECLDKLS